MNYYFKCNDFFEQYKNTGTIKTSIKNYIHNNYNILKDFYFEPKKLLESTLGIEENITMLLAHEYTHWIREKEIKHKNRICL